MLLRSALFVPADQDRKLARSLGAGADALILDLEDSVAPARKAAAREMSGAFLKSSKELASRPLLLVRINPLSTTEWEADAAAAIAHGADGLVLPKPRNGGDVHRMSVALDHMERRAGVAAGRTRIIAIATETAQSVLEIGSYAGSSTRLAALTWGAEDLSAEIGARGTRDEEGRLASPFRLARDLCLMASAAARVDALDTVFLDINDTEGLIREAAAAARDGFTGKLAIHPAQVATINRAVTPDAAAIADAEAVVRAFRAAGAETGVLAHQGRMLDRPHLLRAERTLARARAASRAPQ